jgi:hypothetical protein
VTPEPEWRRKGAEVFLARPHAIVDVAPTGDPDIGDLRLRFCDTAWQQFDV